MSLKADRNTRLSKSVFSSCGRTGSCQLRACAHPSNCRHSISGTQNMHASTARDAFQAQPDQRAQPRFTVALPALASCGSRRFSISIVNIAAEGAMIESWSVLLDRARLLISCGTTDVMATVVWQGSDRLFGVRFDRSLTLREISEQISRSSALQNRREQKQGQRRGPAEVSLERD